MRKFFFLFLAFILVSCSGEAVKRLVPVADEPSEADEEVSDGNIETPDDTVVPPDENGGQNEVQDEDKPEINDETLENPDEEEKTENDSDIQLPDEEKPENDSDASVPDEENPENDSDISVSDDDTDQENPDDVWSGCGTVFNGSNCIASSCETVEDCCEADICVATDGCGGRKVCRSAFFKENFDSYTAGSFPPKSSGWTLKYQGQSQRYQIVTSERYFSAENSMQLLGNQQKNYSAIMTAVLPQVPDVINVEMRMNPEGDDVSFALCSFEREDDRTNWGDMYLKVEFADGKIRYQIPEWTVYDVAPSYEANEWYKLRVKMNQTAKTISVWVNDELKVENQAFNLDSWSIPNICLASNKNYKKVWFDDIFVWGE